MPPRFKGFGQLRQHGQLRGPGTVAEVFLYRNCSVYHGSLIVFHANASYSDPSITPRRGANTFNLMLLKESLAKLI